MCAKNSFFQNISGTITSVSIGWRGLFLMKSDARDLRHIHDENINMVWGTPPIVTFFTMNKTQLQPHTATVVDVTRLLKQKTKNENASIDCTKDDTNDKFVLVIEVYRFLNITCHQFCCSGQWSEWPYVFRDVCQKFTNVVIDRIVDHCG